MKRFSYYAISILVIAAVGLFVIKQPNGNSVLSIDDLEHAISDLKTLMPNDIDLPDINIKKEGQVNVYMWVDEQGVTHYSDVPVEGAKQAELAQITVLPAEKVEWPKSQMSQHKTLKDNVTKESYFEQINNVKADAERVKQQLEVRAKKQQEVLNNL